MKSVADICVPSQTKTHPGDVRSPSSLLGNGVASYGALGHVPPAPRLPAILVFVHFGVNLTAG